MKSTYAISDLHLGGAFREGQRVLGARLTSRPLDIASFVEKVVLVDDHATRLVVHGDILDFLALDSAEWASELEDQLSPTQAKELAVRNRLTGPLWLPFLRDEAVAVKALDRLLQPEDQAVLDAFGKVLAHGKELVLILGNHDLELAYPAVDRALRERLGTNGSRAKIVNCGTTFPVDRYGHCVIVHGNEMDGWNSVNYARLNEFASGEGTSFLAPPGSELVAQLMNVVKATYPFVDLLKPEQTLAIPLLLALAPHLALEPAHVEALTSVSKYYLQYWYRRRLVGDAAVGDPPSRLIDAVDPVTAVLELELQALSPPDEQKTDSPTAELYADAAVPIKGVVGTLADLVAARRRAKRGEEEARTSREVAKTLQPYVQALVDEEAFNREVEGCSWMRSHVERLHTAGAKVVVAGHTHLPKWVGRNSSRTYINTGTWADVIHLRPEHCSTPEQLENVISVIRAEQGNLQSLLAPTRGYAKVDLTDEGELDSAILVDF